MTEEERQRENHANRMEAHNERFAQADERKRGVRDLVYQAIDTERAWQDRKWGTVEKHPHEVGGWLTIMRKLLGDAEAQWATNGGDHQALIEIRKVLAVGVACAEQHGLPERSKHQEMKTHPRDPGRDAKWGAHQL